MPTGEIATFWEQTRNTLAQVRMDAVMELVDQTDVFSMEGDMNDPKDIFRGDDQPGRNADQGVVHRAYWRAPWKGMACPPGGARI